MKSGTGRAMLAALCALALALAPIVQLAGVSAAPATVQVTIATKDSSRNIGVFTPSTITVRQGDTVEWVNADRGTHSVQSGQVKDRDSGKMFRSDDIRKGHTFSHTFAATGTYHYFCKIHPVMTGTVVVESAPPALSLAPLVQQYGQGQSITVRGTTSLVSGEPVSVEVYSPSGEQYILDSTTVAKNGSFSYTFTSAQAAGAHRIVAKYLGATAVTTFQVGQKAGTTATGIAVSATMTGRTVAIAVKNSLPSDIYRVSFAMPDDPGSARAPRDWSAELDGRNAVFYTEVKPIHEGKRVAFRVVADPPVSSFSWVAFGASGEVISTGSATVRTR